jgi:hypothetical protein
VDRRTFVRTTLGLGTGVALGGSLWRGAAAAAQAPAVPGVGPYGPLLAADAAGVRLPAGFLSRVVARSGQAVGARGYVWHGAPDGGACFGLADGGWLYASNSEEPERRGGVGVLRFDARGAVTDAYRILGGTSRNCAGGATPWGTWLSCEEVRGGYVFETWPAGDRAAARRPAMGRFKHEAAAVDPERRCVYLTEDEAEGAFYRFVPTTWPDLSTGRLDVLCGPRGRSVDVRWVEVPDASGAQRPTRSQVSGVKRFNGGEGCHYDDGKAWFTTKGSDRVWRYDAVADRVDVVYDAGLIGSAAPLRGVDNIVRAAGGDLLVAEDGGDMEICLISPGGIVSRFAHVVGHGGSEITGPAFSPDGTRLYFSSQRGSDGDGVTFEVRGPFRRPAGLPPPV